MKVLVNMYSWLWYWYWKCTWNTVRLKMYYQKKFKQWCDMVNFTKFMIHMHLGIKNKINMWALFWLDQNYRFFIAKLTVFWSHFSLPKNDQFCYKEICNFDPIQKGLLEWFWFSIFCHPKTFMNMVSHQFSQVRAVCTTAY